MSRAAIRVVVLAGILTGASSPALGDPITFDEFDDSTFLDTQISGLTFSNAVIGTAGVSFNELDLPPKSFANVVFDVNGPMRIDFAAPIISFEAYFNYFVPLTLRAFNDSGALIDSVSSAFSTNSVNSGDPGSSPNELLSLAFPGGIDYVTLTGLDTGTSFVLDDLSYVLAANQAVPEPSTLLLIGTGVGMLLRRRHKRRSPA